MRYFAVLFFLFLTASLYSQEKTIHGIVYSELSYYPEPNANVLNLSSLKVAQTNNDGAFSLLAKVNDTLHISAEGFKSLKIKVTNDWFKDGTMNIYIKDMSTLLDEVVINTLNLTGILSVDSRLITLAEYPYYRDYNPTGFVASYNSGFNPINGIYNAVKRNSSQTKKINQIREEIELIEVMKTKYDREMVSALINIPKEDIVKLLQRCNYTERFIYTASDYQIFNAVNECYANYKLLN